MGPKKVESFTNAGYTDLEAVSRFDARKDTIPEGTSKEFMRQSRNEARKLLAASGKPVVKAKYAAPKSTTTPVARDVESGVKEADPVVSIKNKESVPEPRKPSFLQRILRRN